MYILILNNKTIKIYITMMNMETRNEYLKEVRRNYLKASRKEKSIILSEAEKITKMDRKTLIKKLKAESNIDKRKEDKRKKPKYYDNEVKAALEKLWEIFDFPCGKRLKSNLKPEILSMLLREGEICLSDKVMTKLLKISPPSIDRCLEHARKTRGMNVLKKSKSNPLLFDMILTKTSSEFDRTVIGNIEMDHVEHCGSNKGGNYVCSLSNVDVASGWFEGEAMINMGQEKTHKGIKRARQRMPFNWKEMHPDNGTSFINDMVYRYAKEEGIEFTRSRPYKKNDNCWVEQNNRTHIRRMIGILRYDTKKELDIINDLYRNEIRLYKNFFCPCMKLISKERIDGKMHKEYDEPKTPYERLMESNQINDEKKMKLRKIYESLNPAELKRNIDRKIMNLYNAYKEKKNPKKGSENSKKENGFGIILNDSTKVISVS